MLADHTQKDLTTLEEVQIAHHGSLKLRLQLIPGKLQELQSLLDQFSFWAQGRNISQLRKMLKESDVVVTAWHRSKIIGFGRATSDSVFRAVLWDIVVADSFQGQGVGKRIVRSILQSKKIRSAEKVYAMTSRQADFYRSLGFHESNGQSLMVKNKSG